MLNNFENRLQKKCALNYYFLKFWLEKCMVHNNAHLDLALTLEKWDNWHYMLPKRGCHLKKCLHNMQHKLSILLMYIKLFIFLMTTVKLFCYFQHMLHNLLCSSSPPASCHTDGCKLMRLGLTNRDNSDSKPANFDRRFRFDSKSNDKSKSAIAVSI